MSTDDPILDPVQTQTLEAFADTIIPGEKRHPTDRAIAGAAAGAGAVAAGALELLQLPAVGLVDVLPILAESLNDHADLYAQQHNVPLDPAWPGFVGLPFDDRAALVHNLTSPGHPQKDHWVGLALFCIMAFDTAAHLSTPEALADGHPGLTTIGLAAPTADGRWSFPSYSYGRKLAALHPQTTRSGSPA